MIVFPSMLVQAAVKAGMKVPEDVDNEWNSEEFIHWSVFCALQLGVPVTWGNHWENAKLIASIPEDKIMTMTHMDFENLGFSP